MYLIKLDMFSEFEQGENPEFVCENLEELTNMVQFFFKNGYDVFIKQVGE